MSDTERDSFYLGALLHDLGKFIQRAEIDEWNERADEYVKSGDASKGDYTHKRYSAAFIKKFRNKTGIFPQDAAAESYALWHHRGKDRSKFDNESINKKGVPLKLIHIADISASKERQTDAEIDSQDYNLAKLESIFCNVALRNSDEQLNSFPEKRYINLGALTCKYESAFPLSKEPAYHEQNHTTLVNEFLARFEKSIGKTKELQPFLVKYLHAVPAQTPFKKKDHQEPYRPDINLFDHSRVTAAIALCLYDEWIQGDWRGKDKQILDDTENGYKCPDFPAPCLLVSVDISGIQDFIFNVPSKGAAKTLKARSFFVQMLADVCVEKVLHDLDLKPANLLYNGGGQFYFLLPKCKSHDLNACKEEIARALIDEELFLSIASVEVKVVDFMDNFGKKWKGVNDQLSIEKLRKFKGQKRKDVFGPFKQVVRENNERDPFFEITDKKFRKNDYYRILAESSGVKVPEEEEKKSWVDILGKLGYRFEFQKMGAHESIAFNTTKFEGEYAGFRFSVKDLPRWESETIALFEQDVESCGRSIEEYQDEDENGVKRKLKDGDIITYSQLAFKAYKETGTHKLGILKMDVDNLGKLFSEGFSEETRTPSRMMSLSRSLQWFFEGYMNTLLEKEYFKDYLYPIFSGGDDLFIVGAWHKVFDMALRIQNDFREFICENPSVTLSASLLVVDEHYPVSRFAVLAEERLHEAKYGSLDKNSVNVFGQTLSWEELEKAQRVKSRLEELVDENGQYKVPRSIIYKVLNGCEGLTSLHDRAMKLYQAEKTGDKADLSWLRQQPPVGEKIWRMSYMLRDIKSDDNEARNKAKDIIQEYESVVFEAMRGRPVNPMYIAVGGRWAEMATRGRC